MEATKVGIREFRDGIASLKKASKTLDRLLAAKSNDVDALVAEFKTARKRKNTANKPVSVSA